jgi:hypothetical protein
MATITWYLQDSTFGNDGWQQLVTTPDFAAATSTVGWVVGTGAANNSEMQSGAERAATTFLTATPPDGTLDTTLKDAMRTPVLNGTFAAGNWTFNFGVISVTSGGAADGQIVFRLIKASADGSGATEITTAQQTASLCTNVPGTGEGRSVLTVNPGAITLTNQYLFVQVAWKRTGAGGMTTTNIRFTTGFSPTAGTAILSTDFTPAGGVTQQPMSLIL